MLKFRQRFSIDLDERLLRQEKSATAGVITNLTTKVSVTLAGTADLTGADEGTVQR